MTEHDRYVNAGGCPSARGKVWCNAKAGHGGVHWAIRVPTPGIPKGPNNPTKITWTDKDWGVTGD